MDSAKKLFTTLVALTAAGPSGTPPGQRLIHYCTKVLGGLEGFHCDFKLKQDCRNATLQDNDKKNLAKAVSGFANSAGGVLIWGIEDGTLKPTPITGIREFVQSLLHLAAQITDPVVPDIDGDWVPDGNPTGQTGFGLIYVPESSLPPHRVILKHKDIAGHYYVRSGESFVIATHTQLEDMFGRRPKPILDLKSRIEASDVCDGVWYMRVVLAIENKGRGSARAPFLRLCVHPPYEVTHRLSKGQRAGLRELAYVHSRERKYGGAGDDVIHPGVDHDVTAIDLKVSLSSTKSGQDVRLDYEIAAEGVQPVSGQRTIPWNEIVRETQGLADRRAADAERTGQ